MSRAKGKAQAKFVALQGVGNSTRIKPLSYAEAKALVNESGIQTVAQFHKWNRPVNIPANPAALYAHSGWQSWSQFFTKDIPQIKTTIELNSAELSLLCDLLKADVMNGGQGYDSMQEEGDSSTSSDELLYRLEPTEEVKRLIAEFCIGGKFR